MQEYRSGHNEAVLKTVRPKATGVRIPLPAPNKRVALTRSATLLFNTNETEGFERSVKRLFRGMSRSGDRRILRNINKQLALIVSQNSRTNPSSCAKKNLNRVRLRFFSSICFASSIEQAQCYCFRSDIWLRQEIIYFKQIEYHYE